MQPQANRPQPAIANQSDPTDKRTWVGRVILLILLAIILTIFWQRQAVSDWIRLVNYNPPAEVADLATQTTMTGEGTHLFYVNQPLIVGKTSFPDYCSDREQSIVLGCYHGGDGGIYLLRIADNSELGGVMEVTAAHEMLHAGYARLSEDARKAVDAQLQDYYDHGLKDKAIKEEIDAYRSSEPGQLLNEMHSIFGTEVKDLPAPLETYYKQYFTNRQAVVAEADRYQEAFRSREAAVAKYDAQLKTLDKTITSQRSQLQDLANTITAMKQRMDADKASGNYESYNAQVPEFNRLVRQYNELRNELLANIKTYNDIVEKRNAIALEEQQLVDQLKGSDVPSLN